MKLLSLNWICKTGCAVFICAFWCTGVAQPPLWDQPVLMQGTARIVRSGESASEKEVSYVTFLDGRDIMVQIRSSQGSELVASRDDVVSYYVKGAGPFYADVAPPTSFSFQAASVSPLWPFPRLWYLRDDPNLTSNRAGGSHSFVYTVPQRGLEALGVMSQEEWVFEGGSLQSMTHTLFHPSDTASAPPVSAFTLSDHDQNGIPQTMHVFSRDMRAGNDELDFEVFSKVSSVTYPADSFDVTLAALSRDHLPYEQYRERAGTVAQRAVREAIVDQARVHQGFPYIRWFLYAGGGLLVLALLWRILRKG